MRDWLEAHGWSVETRLSQTGPDISAVDPNGTTWLFEVKGYPATFRKKDGSTKSRNIVMTQRGVWFIEALGQVVSRIRHVDMQYALVFPDHPTDHYFEEKALSLPTFLRSKLNLWVILISSAQNTRVLAPGSNEFEAWSNGPI
jgi:hypothetical protein